MNTADIRPGRRSLRRTITAVATAFVAIFASLAISSSPAQASAHGCDPFPSSPVRVTCFGVTGSGLWVQKVDFASVNREYACNQEARLEAFDRQGRRTWSYTRWFGCDWGATTGVINVNRNLPAGSICGRHMVNGAQKGGVCHTIKP